MIENEGEPEMGPGTDALINAGIKDENYVSWIALIFFKSQSIRILNNYNYNQKKQNIIEVWIKY